ncbi:MAG: MATE family efflux transporter [Acholeplasmatales bacterium]|nr:MATE family efflux transporter [Acholeplasmatales bacterium]
MLISEHLNYKKIFKLTIFPIIMMIFTSLYSIVDGIFVSNFSSDSAFAAVNLVMPFIMIVGSIGFMMGTGGTALVSKYLGEQNKEKANKAFSLIVYSTIIIGIVVSIISFVLMKPIVVAMGNINKDTSKEMVDEAIIYGRLLISFNVLFMLQNLFQSFFLVEERSKLGFLITVGAGITNIILDALLIGVFKLGVVGAALATISGYLVASLSSILFFKFKKKGIIFLGKAEKNFKIIYRSAYNGLSEFVGNISLSVVSIVYNIQLLRLYGENGVSAYGIIMYVSFVFVAIFIGYSLGIAPAVGYNYGAQKTCELKNILKKSTIIMFILGLLMTVVSLLTAKPFSMIFSNGNDDLLDLSIKAMKIYSFHFLICGFSIFISSFFTALNNGTASALISLLRTLVFQIIFVLAFPVLFGNTSIWWACFASDLFALIISVLFLLIYKKKYNYM